MSCTNIFKSLKTELIENFSKSFINNDNNTYFLAIGRPIPWSRDPIDELNNFDDNFYIPLQLTGNSLGTFEDSLFQKFSYLLGDDSNFPRALDTQKEKSNFYKGNIFIKRISPENFSFLVKKNTWTAGEIYDPYRDNDEIFAEDKKFFVYNEADQGVYKCIDNNNGSRSLVVPEQSQSETDFRLSDGYIWKLMYTMSTTDSVKYSIDGISEGVQSYMPVKIIDYNYDLNTQEQQQYEIQQASLPNSISFVEVNPDFKDHITFDPYRCVIDEIDSCVVFNDATAGSTVVDIVQCSNLVNHPPSYSSNSNYLSGLVFNVVSGDGAGQRRIISSSRNIAQVQGGQTTSIFLRLNLESPLDDDLSGFVSTGSPSTFTIEPQIKVIGDGEALNPAESENSQLTTADLKPVFTLREGETSKTLDYIQILNPGKNYTVARAIFTAGITHYYPSFSGAELLELTNAFNTNNNNFLTPVLPPNGGHGRDALRELGSSEVLFKVDLETNESGKLPASNDFRQLALLKNPLLNDPVIQMRFVESANTSLVVGATVTSQNASGKIIRVYEFPNSVGSEIYVSGISGSFENDTVVSISGTTYNLDPFDGYRKFEIAGTENKNLLILNVKTNASGGNQFLPRDILVGLGSVENKIFPSYATGVIRDYQDNGSSVEFTLENVKGTYNLGEKIGCIRKPTSTPNSGDFDVFGSSDDPNDGSEVLSYRYSQDNFKNSYSLTTKITVRCDAAKKFNLATFYEDQPIYSFESASFPKAKLQENVKGTAHIFKWDILGGGTTVEMYVIGTKKGIFKVGDYIPYAIRNDNETILYAEITEVVDSDVRYDTGEVIHIQNMKPISRTETSKEEISLVLGV
jgi:hypothetical protein